MSGAEFVKQSIIVVDNNAGIWGRGGSVKEAMDSGGIKKIREGVRAFEFKFLEKDRLSEEDISDWNKSGYDLGKHEAGDFLLPFCNNWGKVVGQATYQEEIRLV
jgi:hypothetical protein